MLNVQESGPQMRPTQWWPDSLGERVERTVEWLGAVRACGVLHVLNRTLVIGFDITMRAYRGHFYIA